MSDAVAADGGEIHWGLRLFVGFLGATASLSGPALNAYNALAAAPDDASSRGLPIIPMITVLSGWGAVWLLSIVVVTYHKETHVVALAVTALGLPGAFVGLSLLAGSS